LKSDPRTDRPDDAAIAGMPLAGLSLPAGQLPPPLVWTLRIVRLVAVPLLILAAASGLALGIVRVGADLRLGLDPFGDATARAFLPMRELAGRALAVDAVRQVLIAAIVIGITLWRYGSGWRARLALVRPAWTRVRLGRLWLLLLLWPLLHIAWVAGTAEALHLNFGRGVRLSPILSPAMVMGWLVYVGLLAPLAEELLLRGQTFARAEEFLRPASAIVATALLFCAAHISEMGLARPITLLPLAVTLGWLRWRTGRLWPCILLHGWSNLAVVAYQIGPSHL